MLAFMNILIDRTFGRLDSFSLHNNSFWTTCLNSIFQKFGSFLIQDASSLFVDFGIMLADRRVCPRWNIVSI